MKGWTILTGGLLCVVLAGCSASEGEVSGTVLCDNEPLKEGQIIFEDPAGATTPMAGKITDGKYTVPKVPPGAKKVKINGSRAPGKPDPVMGAAAREEMVAKEFNSETTLTAEVKAGRQEGVDFKVKSIPRK